MANQNFFFLQSHVRDKTKNIILYFGNLFAKRAKICGVWARLVGISLLCYQYRTHFLNRARDRFLHLHFDKNVHRVSKITVESHQTFNYDGLKYLKRIAEITSFQSAEPMQTFDLNCMKSFNLTDLALEATDLHYFHQRQDIPLHCFLMISVTIFKFKSITMVMNLSK